MRDAGPRPRPVGGKTSLGRCKSIRSAAPSPPHVIRWSSESFNYIARNLFQVSPYLWPKSRRRGEGGWTGERAVQGKESGERGAIGQTSEAGMREE